MFDAPPTLTLLDGHRRWLWPDGTVLPVVSGGADDGGEGAGGESGGAGAGDGGGAGAAAGQGSGDSGAAGNEEGKGGEGKAADDGKKFTQAEVAEMVARERAKAKKSFEAEAKTAAERAKMDEAERLKAEKADADKAVEDAKREVLVGKVETRAERLALKAKVHPDRVDRFLKIADTASSIDDLVTEDGAPDDKAIAKLIESTLKEWPEFKTTAGTNGASGGEFNGQNGMPAQLSRDDLKGMTPKEITAAKKEGRLKVLLGQT